MGGSPYGVLPEPPRATPLPENKVGLTQQRAAAAGLAGGTPRPMALISPRQVLCCVVLRSAVLCFMLCKA